MNSGKFLFVSLIICFCTSCAFSQNRGWIFISHTQKLNSKWDLLFDAQVRTGDKFKQVNTLLLRSAVKYNLDKKNSLAAGYASKNDWEKEDDETSFQPEHRIYQQYLFETELGKAELTARARFEQRFIRSENAYLFSQRGRVFAAIQIPVFAKKGFERGVYINFQEEIFLNISHSNRVNNSFFDQNRILGSLGYRWNDKIDTELGYMWWCQREHSGDQSTNVIQLMITTSF